MNKKIAQIIKDLDIIVLWNNKCPNRGCWHNGKTIEMRSKNEPAYAFLHEIGHTIVGKVCCWEHREYMAHGAAAALAKVYGIRFTEKELRQIDAYAGFSTYESCDAIKDE